MMMPPLLTININLGLGEAASASQMSSSVQLLFLVTIISLAPSILIMMTCFTRIIIVFHFIRSALGTQQMPPNQILIGLTLFLTLFVMGGIFTEINENALKPLSAGQINQDEALERGMEPLREFMFSQVEETDLKLFMNLSKEDYSALDGLTKSEIKADESLTAQIPSRVLIPAFILGEVTRGFKAGFAIYLPFIVIDMVVASTLMAMGMMMLPPAMISLPFKILLWVMVDGWSLTIGSLVDSFMKVIP